MEHYINLTQGKVVDLAPDYGAANSMYVLIALGAALLVAAVIVQLVTRR